MSTCLPSFQSQTRSLLTFLVDPDALVDLSLVPICTHRHLDTKTQFLYLSIHSMTRPKVHWRCWPKHAATLAPTADPNHRFTRSITPERRWMRTAIESKAADQVRTEVDDPVTAVIIIRR
jgi:hypothetical protein